MARIERRLVATRTDHRLTLTELAEFIRDAEDADTDPGSWLKAQTSVRGYVRSVEIVPDPERQNESGGQADGC